MTYDIVALGNALVDVLAEVDESLLVKHGLTKGAMILTDSTKSAARVPIMVKWLPTSWVTCSRMIWRHKAWSLPMALHQARSRQDAALFSLRQTASAP
jgi:hypothetical protein